MMAYLAPATRLGRGVDMRRFISVAVLLVAGVVTVIVFTRLTPSDFTGPSMDIWSYPIDSGTVSIADGLPVVSEDGVIDSHDISSDGRRIAFSTIERGDWIIVVRAVEGGEQPPVTNRLEGGIAPHWSPGGTELAFHRYVGDEMWVMVSSAGGGTPVKVASAPRTSRSAWSPSGLELAFNATRSGTREAWVVSRETVGGAWSEPTRLTDVDCELSDWAPDGSGVLCAVDTGTDSDRRTSLVLVSRDGGVVWRSEPTTAGMVRTSGYWKFSSDGSTVYASGTHEDGREGIWAMPVQDGEPRLVVAYDRADVVAAHVNIAVGPDRLYVTVQHHDDPTPARQQ